MKLYCFLLVATTMLLSCHKGFFLMQGNDFHYHTALNGPFADTLHRFNEGIYLARICSYENIVDGQQIYGYRSCPTAALDADSLDKTAFFIFLDHQRVLYYSNDALWSSNRRVRHNNDVSNVDIRLDQSSNRKKKILRGYYAIEPLTGDTAGSLLVKMHLEKVDSAQVFIDLKLDKKGVLSVLKIGYADKANFKGGTIPPMISWNSVFGTGMDFHFYDKGKPSVFINGKKIGSIEFAGDECHYLESGIENGVVGQRVAPVVAVDKTGQLSAW